MHFTWTFRSRVVWLFLFCSTCVRACVYVCFGTLSCAHDIFTRHRYILYIYIYDKKAAEIFEEAQEGGKGFCGTYPEEEAELYVEQFTRCEPIIYADMEKEGSQQGAQDGGA